MTKRRRSEDASVELPEGQGREGPVTVLVGVTTIVPGQPEGAPSTSGNIGNGARATS